jgi:hypothetical protein
MTMKNLPLTKCICWYIQSVPGRKVSILGGHSIDYSKQKIYVYVHVSHSEWFLR